VVRQRWARTGIVRKGKRGLRLVVWWTNCKRKKGKRGTKNRSYDRKAKDVSFKKRSTIHGEGRGIWGGGRQVSNEGEAMRRNEGGGRGHTNGVSAEMVTKKEVAQTGREGWSRSNSIRLNEENGGEIGNFPATYIISWKLNKPG